MPWRPHFAPSQRGPDAPSRSACRCRLEEGLRSMRSMRHACGPWSLRRNSEVRVEFVALCVVVCAFKVRSVTHHTLFTWGASKNPGVRAFLSHTLHRYAPLPLRSAEWCGRLGAHLALWLIAIILMLHAGLVVAYGDPRCLGKNHHLAGLRLLF